MKVEAQREHIEDMKTEICLKGHRAATEALAALCQRFWKAISNLLCTISRRARRYSIYEI